ncbi:MAG: Hsp70 family protein, partial [Bacteroidales bacterium]|nr:Hsp70 family protein [Bacteroidales bacterium]
ADKAAKERVEKINGADSLIFQTEKSLKEYGDKIPADKKAPIEEALKELKDAHQKQDIAAIDAASAKLNSAFQAASQDMYAAGAGQQQAGPQPGAGQQQASGNKGGDDVTDVDFEEVK